MRREAIYRVSFRRRGKVSREDRIDLMVEATTYRNAAKAVGYRLRGMIVPGWVRSWVIRSVTQTVL